MFFNFMNLDINNGGGHFGSSFLYEGFQIFPTLFASLSHPSASGSSGICALSTQLGHYETYSYRIPCPTCSRGFHQSVQLSHVYVALNPVQFAQLSSQALATCT